MTRDPDPATRQELSALLDQDAWEQLQTLFAARLGFGTAGLRGIVGPGPARMNRLVVRETTTGLARTLLDTFPDTASRGVVVGYDGRLDSLRFAQDAATVLRSLGIIVHLSDRAQPTPLCAFAIRHLHAVAGLVITASHNPPEYNGYKVFWENGAQIIPPHDETIAKNIDQAALEPIPWKDIDWSDSSACSDEGIEIWGDALSQAYLQGLDALMLHTPTPVRKQMILAYTPLHGVGAPMAERTLRHLGFERVHTVASQRKPDGRFPTVRFPNPEEPGAMDAVLALGREVNADLVLANDPDADRLAVAVKSNPRSGRSTGDYVMLTGNETGILLGWDRLRQNGAGLAVGSTLPSSRMLKAIALAEGATYVESLTGFKWIANNGLRAEEKGKRFVFGYEEALGYGIGTLVRDKDGISALASLCELAAECRERGMDLLQQLDALYVRYGLYLTQQKSIILPPGTLGSTLTDRLRAKPPAEIGGHAVLSTMDLISDAHRFQDGREEKIGLPPGDVLIFMLQDNIRVVVRPSGTEPKVKCYYEVQREIADQESLNMIRAEAQALLDSLAHAHQQEVGSVIPPV